VASIYDCLLEIVNCLKRRMQSLAGIPLIARGCVVTACVPGEEQANVIDFVASIYDCLLEIVNCLKRRIQSMAGIPLIAAGGVITACESGEGQANIIDFSRSS